MANQLEFVHVEQKQNKTSYSNRSKKGGLSRFPFYFMEWILERKFFAVNVF